MGLLPPWRISFLRACIDKINTNHKSNYCHNLDPLRDVFSFFVMFCVENCGWFGNQFCGIIQPLLEGSTQEGSIPRLLKTMVIQNGTWLHLKWRYIHHILSCSYSKKLLTITLTKSKQLNCWIPLNRLLKKFDRSLQRGTLVIKCSWWPNSYLHCIFSLKDIHANST